MRPPLIGLTHELLHASDYANGTLLKGKTGSKKSREISVTGLPYDHDGDGTADENELALTENKFRAILGLPERMKY